MPNNVNDADLEAAGSWAKRYFLASREVVESVLRPYDLGNTQWYVLGVLVDRGPLKQRDLTRELEVERATLSAVISALVRKGYIEQHPDPEDQRQKILQVTPAGRTLLASVPDPIAIIAAVAFADVSDADIATTNQVLKDATQRLIDYKKGATKS
ncbi:MarR family transcriptional regulator [Arthrobacter livingstonensis]|uniref:MarR family transcriptional regulator n=1 Tax=Arthrobacter livingstonensis TaxID=670078 RepID=A0A2V5LHT7_9MICC|nr:MarR family transcriptional regulator [Arthrobacter livingstonensis]PYI69763.1 MarR family transcriptional regulator [Arthrobacter livingstonensis]